MTKVEDLEITEAKLDEDFIPTKQEEAEYNYMQGYWDGFEDALEKIDWMLIKIRQQQAEDMK